MDDTNRDQPRLAATGRDNDYTLSLEEVAERYAKAGHARTLRTLQRYCASGHLDAQKIATTTGDKYLVTPQSVARHIAQIEELNALEAVATSRDVSRQAATERSEEISQEFLAPEGDKARQAATGQAVPPEQVARLEREVGRLEDDREFLREQIKVKDGQIADLSTRFGNLSDRFADTQKLLGAMQRMLAPILGQSDPFTSPEKREVSKPETAADAPPM